MSINETLLPSKPAIPWKKRLPILMMSLISDVTRRSNGTVNRRLFKLFDFKHPSFPNMALFSVLSSDITVDPARNLWFRLYTPTKSGGDSSLPVVVFFHGGGFSFLSAASSGYDIICRRFARKVNAIVVSVNYRLAPEHRCPSQYDDGFDVLRFLDKNQASGLLPPNADLSKCFIAGDSSGANLAHHVTVRACRAKFRVVNIIGLVSMQPCFGGQERTPSEIEMTKCPLVTLERTDWCWAAFLPYGLDRDHYVVNVSGPNAEDISGLDFPSTILFVGGFDPLQDWQMRYYQWLKKSGKNVSLIEYPNMFHSFYIFPDLPESSHLVLQVKDFVAQQLSKHTK